MNHISASQLGVFLNEGKEIYACKYLYGFKDETESDDMLSGKAFEDLLMMAIRGESYDKLRSSTGTKPLKKELVEALGEEHKKLGVDELEAMLREKDPNHAVLNKLGELSARNKAIEILNYLTKEICFPFGEGELQVKVTAQYKGVELLGYLDFKGMFNGEKATVDVKYTGNLSKWNIWYASKQLQKDMYPFIQDLNGEEVLPFYYFVCGWEDGKAGVKIFRYELRGDGVKFITENVDQLIAFAESDEWKEYKHDEVLEKIKENLGEYTNDYIPALYQYIAMKNCDKNIITL